MKLKQTEENNKVKLKLALKGSYNLNQNTVNYQKEVEETKETISKLSYIQERLNEE